MSRAPDSDAASEEAESDPATTQPPPDGREAADSLSDADVVDLRARVDLLQEENRRLREEYARRRRTEYQRASLALVGVGVLAAGAAAVVPAVRETLVIVAAIGVFGGVLTRYLTPERFVSATVGERVYSTLAGNHDALVGELGLQDERLYVPVDGPERVRLFVPERREYSVPSDSDLAATLVVPDEETARGAAFAPTGVPLLREFEQSTVGSPPSDPRERVAALATSLVESFELVESTTVDVDAATGRASVDVVGGVFGDGDTFDDPVASTLATGLATALDTPVTVESNPTEDGYTVTCRWEADAAASVDDDGETAAEAAGDRQDATE